MFICPLKTQMPSAFRANTARLKRNSRPLSRECATLTRSFTVTLGIPHHPQAIVQPETIESVPSDAPRPAQHDAEASPRHTPMQNEKTDELEGHGYARFSNGLLGTGNSFLNLGPES